MLLGSCRRALPPTAQEPPQPELLGTWRATGGYYVASTDGEPVRAGETIQTLTFTRSRWIHHQAQVPDDGTAGHGRTDSGTWEVAGDTVIRKRTDYDGTVTGVAKTFHWIDEVGDVLFMHPWDLDFELRGYFVRYSRVQDPLPFSLTGTWTGAITGSRAPGRVPAHPPAATRASWRSRSGSMPAVRCHSGSRSRTGRSSSTSRRSGPRIGSITFSSSPNRWRSRRVAGTGFRSQASPRIRRCAWPMRLPTTRRRDRCLRGVERGRMAVGHACRSRRRPLPGDSAAPAVTRAYAPGRRRPPGEWPARAGAHGFGYGRVERSPEHRPSLSRCWRHPAVVHCASVGRKRGMGSSRDGHQP